MGEIGGNDYYNALFSGKSIEQVEKYVPFVIEAIASAINVRVGIIISLLKRQFFYNVLAMNLSGCIALQELIALGVSTLLVPGDFPFGCVPAFLTRYQTSDEDEYDPSTGCLNWLNKFTEYHNELLQIELRQIRSLHPHVNIIYADYYNAMLELYQSPDQFGISTPLILQNILQCVLINVRIFRQF